MQGVFNPNIPIFPPNSAEGLHFSAFHLKLHVWPQAGNVRCQVYPRTTEAAFFVPFPLPPQCRNDAALQDVLTVISWILSILQLCTYIDAPPISVGTVLADPYYGGCVLLCVELAPSSSSGEEPPSTSL